ncbi:class I SAM-dependent methyltransferase [Dethiothermospora halolimnae]|uniref:class I SAM-dependent methyltransferase n=1 Tax=Dethiothermospora halolimnae TaxID=3114390 RepID=UPI003CCBCD87
MDKISCKICNNKVDIIYDEKFDNKYYSCTECEFIFIDEDHMVSKKREVKQYNQHENTLDNEGYVNMFKDFLNRAVLPWKDNIKKALDFGCGPGPVLKELLKSEGFDVDIYDFYFQPEKVFENKKYDLITSTEVFEHLSEPRKTFKMLKEHLNREGILSIMTLFHTNDEEDFKKWWYRRDPTHISFYTPKTLKILGNIFDMKIVYIGDKNTCVFRKN